VRARLHSLLGLGEERLDHSGSGGLVYSPAGLLEGGHRLAALAERVQKLREHDRRIRDLDEPGAPSRELDRPGRRVARVRRSPVVGEDPALGELGHHRDEVLSTTRVVGDRERFVGQLLGLGDVASLE
jgi:hypothetical protein